MLVHDAQKAFLIPDDSREGYFKIIDDLCGATGRQGHEAIDPKRDPIIIVNLEYLTQRNWELLEKKLLAIGAREITDMVEMELYTGPQS
jgi:hypothetical protein